jgi:hypothetical protein
MSRTDSRVAFREDPHSSSACADTCTPSVPIFMHVSAYSCNCRYTAVSSYPGMLQAANGSFKTTNMVLTQGDLCPPDCRKIVAMYAVVVLFALKRNRHDTFLACRNCRRDRTRVYLDNTVVTVVNCCQRVATRFFFMFPFGREHCFDDSYNTFATVTTIWKPGLIGWIIFYVMQIQIAAYKEPFSNTATGEQVMVEL